MLGRRRAIGPGLARDLVIVLHDQHPKPLAERLLAIAILLEDVSDDRETLETLQPVTAPQRRAWPIAGSADRRGRRWRIEPSLARRMADQVIAGLALSE
jgi:hypothetical protein